MSKEINELVAEIACQAGQLALSGFHRSNVTLKEDGTEITEMDSKVEEFIRGRLRSHFPRDMFLGEETSREEEFAALNELSDIRLWVVDPIDGTSSFARGLPVWGVSIAALKNGIVEVGCFHNPLTGDIGLTSQSGEASFNEIITSCTDKRKLDSDDQYLVISRFHNKFRSSFPGKIRSLGSTAAHLCYLAKGSASAVLFSGVGIWDIAAGYEIARRSGATMSYLDGTECPLSDFFNGRLTHKPVIASTPKLIDKVLKTIVFIDS